MPIDDSLIAGFKQADLDADLQIYDWTGADRGIVALGSMARHDEQATAVAKMIVETYRANPQRRGTGVHLHPADDVADDDPADGAPDADAGEVALPVRHVTEDDGIR